MYKVASA